MKSIKVLATFLVPVMVIVSCQKESSESKNQQATLKSSRSEVSAGESVQFTIERGTPGALSKWSVTPNTNVNISRAVSWNQTNSIQFNQSGTYTVNVELRKVWCDSAAAANPGMDTCINSGTVTARTSTVVIVKN